MGSNIVNMIGTDNSGITTKDNNRENRHAHTLNILPQSKKSFVVVH